MGVSAAEIAEATALLRTRGWLSRTPEAFQAALLAECSWQAVAPGTVLTHISDTQGGMYGVARGMLSIDSALGAADAPVVHIAHAPFWFGINPVATGLPRVNGVSARTACIAALVPQHALTSLLQAHPEYWRLLLLQLIDHYRTALQIATDLLIPDSRRRCIAVLLRIADCRSGDALRGEADAGQEELSAMANLSRQTASTILRALAAQGIITLGYRSITIRDAAALRALVDV